MVNLTFFLCHAKNYRNANPANKTGLLTFLYKNY